MNLRRAPQLVLLVGVGVAVYGQFYGPGNRVGPGSYSQDPLSSALQQVYQAQSEGRRADAYRSLSQAANLLATIDPAQDGFSANIQQVASQYQARGFGLQAEKVFQSALQRAANLGETHPVYLQILNAHAQYLAADRQEKKATACGRQSRRPPVDWSAAQSSDASPERSPVR